MDTLHLAATTRDNAAVTATPASGASKNARRRNPNGKRKVHQESTKRVASTTGSPKPENKKHSRQKTATSKSSKKKKNNKNNKTKVAQEDDSDMITITKESINNMPLIWWKGAVNMLTTRHQMEAAVQEILDSNEKHLGFDTETKPVFRKGDSHPPALVQIATSTTVYLFHISKLANHNFDALLPIFCDSTILKTGIAIRNDVSDLQEVCHFHAAGFVDSTVITRDQLRIKNGGLRALTAHFLQGRISKQSQMSNWAADDLSPAQIKYAATDAWVSREIHARALAALPTEEKAPEPVPSPAAADTSQVEFQVRAAIAYEDDNIGKTNMWECNACDIS